MSADWARRTWRSADGLTLAARDYAGAPGDARLPVICLHGLTRNARDFEDLAPWIAAGGRRVLAADMRGRGASQRDPNPMRYILPTYAQDVLALMDQAGIGRAVFVGTSMGGLIAMALAGSRPAAIAGAVLNDVGPQIEAGGLTRIASYAGLDSNVADWDAAADYARRTNAVAFPDYGPADWARFARRLFREADDGRPLLDYDPDIARPIAAGADAATGSALWGLYTALAAAAPVLILRGALSDLLSPATVSAMTRSGRDVTSVTVPGVGHAPMLDEAAARGALSDFLQRIS